MNEFEGMTEEQIADYYRRLHESEMKADAGYERYLDEKASAQAEAEARAGYPE